jgi:hypothetical protein
VEGIESAHKDAIAAMAALGTVAEDQHTTTKGRIRRAMLAVLYGALLEDLSAELMLVTQRPVASVCLAARMRAARVLLPMYNGPDWEAGNRLCVKICLLCGAGCRCAPRAAPTHELLLCAHKCCGCGGAISRRSCGALSARCGGSSLRVREDQSRPWVVSK